MTEKIGSLMIDLQAKILSPEEKELLNHPLVGGVILFSRNYDSRQQLTDLCKQIRGACKQTRLITVDQEGGRVQRFINEFTRLPAFSKLGKLYDENKELACSAAQECGWLMAIELLSTGIDFSLTPVLDLNKGLSHVIGQRAFHSQPEVVIDLAKAFITGMREAGMSATGKHFPGHGSVMLDSHTDIPIDTRSIEDITTNDMLAFAAMIKAGISAIMAAHIIFPNVHASAVGYSQYWLQEILRKKLGFKGIIFSDDLNMEGANISPHYSDRVLAAREAGCDFVLLCNNRKGVIDTLDNLPYQSHLMDKNTWGVLQGRLASEKVEEKLLKKISERINKISEVV